MAALEDFVGARVAVAKFLSAQRASIGHFWDDIDKVFFRTEADRKSASEENDRTRKTSVHRLTSTVTCYAGTAGGYQLPTTTVTDYTIYLNPKQVKEEANGAIRTTNTSYDQGNSRPTGSSVTTTGLTGSTAVPSTTISYDAATGLPTTITPSTGSAITTGYDTWGRARTYSPASGETTVTTYDSAGRVKTVTDPLGAVTTYTYDGTDARGQSEHRGLVTGVSVTKSTERTYTAIGAYDADGNLLRQDTTGGIIQRFTYDTAGQPVSKTYYGDVASTADKAWVGWTQARDGAGRVRREWTPSGAVLTGDTTGAPGSGYSRDYTYDRASRLIKVIDRTAEAGTGVVNPDDPSVITATNCETRDYTFDKNGNRLSLQRTPGAANGGCQASGGTGATTKTWAYDAADRLTTGYVYDSLGRQTTIPVADTPKGGMTPSPGNITLAYYDTDAAKTITQNGQTTGFTLDAAGRRLVQTDGPTGGTPTATSTRHYTDGSDNPGYVTVGSLTERYLGDLTGSLGAIVANGAIQLPIADMIGSVVSQTTLPTTGNATGLDNLNRPGSDGGSQSWEG